MEWARAYTRDGLHLRASRRHYGDRSRRRSDDRPLSRPLRPPTVLRSEEEAVIDRLRNPIRTSLISAVLLAAASPAAGAAHPDRDVAVAISGSERARQGGYVSYTATVQSIGHEAVAGVALRFSLPRSWTIRSMSWSRGSCDRQRATCTLGSLVSGQQALASVVVWAPTAGSGTVRASLSGTPVDGNPANDSASATTIVSSSRCRVALGGGPFRAGVPGTVVASVRLGPNPVAARRVVARGAGGTVSARTNARGVARLPVRFASAGTVRVALPGLTGCHASLGVGAA